MKTVKIMVCDDDKAVRDILQHKIEKLCEECGVQCRICGCDSGEEVLKITDKRQEEAEREAWEPDILFLDIRMPGKNGMEIAEELRKRHRNTILIFVTALSEYACDAFDVGAVHYLLKPFGDDKLREALNRALGEYERQEIADMRQAGQDEPAAILVKRGGVSTKVLLEDIIYAEVFNRKVMLHTTGGDIEYYGKLTELSEWAGGNFYRTHRAYLVNLKYVERYNATTIWLENGTALVSKNQFAGFVRQYMQYISRKKDR